MTHCATSELESRNRIMYQVLDEQKTDRKLFCSKIKAQVQVDYFLRNDVDMQVGKEFAGKLCHLRRAHYQHEHWALRHLKEQNSRPLLSFLIFSLYYDIGSAWRNVGSEF
uniref:Uncharacterized protein n=1 Tax=Parascaris univalens TaxID=6257 RepID=A0A915AJB8_PARUN